MIKIFLIEFLTNKEYYVVTYFLKRKEIKLNYVETYSPKQHRKFNKLYVTANDMVVILDKLHESEYMTQRYDFKNTILYRAIMRLSDVFIKAGVDLKLDYEELQPIIGDKIILSRMFSNNEVSNIRDYYFRKIGKKLPKYNNKVYYMTKKEFNEISDYKGIGVVIIRLIKQLDKIFKEIE